MGKGTRRSIGYVGNGRANQYGNPGDGLPEDPVVYWRERCLELEPKFEELYRQYHEAKNYIKMLASGEHSLCIVDGCESMQDPHSGIGLCHFHLDDTCRSDLSRWDFERNPPTLYADQEPDPYRDCVVYYIDFGKRVKIGTTTNLKRRLASFSQPAEALLAVEPGSYEREAQRHAEFAGLRYDHTELFERGPELMDHIKAVRSMFGDPAQFI